MCVYTCFNEKCEERKKEASKVKNKKAKQHSTPKVVTAHVGGIHLFIFLAENCACTGREGGETSN